MNRSLLVLVCAAGALVLAATAAAKGPSSASVSGPGLDKTLVITGNGEYSGTLLGTLTEEVGYFPAVFGQQPNPMLARRPAGNLGPRLTIRYVVPAGSTQKYRLTQYAYPYAPGGAVTYTKPGQSVFGTETRGGWYRAVGLRRTLVAHGLAPTAAEAAGGSSSANLALVAGIGIPGALAVLGAAGFLATRRRRAAR
jgi:hypothetical protein